VAERFVPEVGGSWFDTIYSSSVALQLPTKKPQDRALKAGQPVQYLVSSRRLRYRAPKVRYIRATANNWAAKDYERS
jgi:hypothetical protein